MDNRVAKVAILASGSGTNAERLMAAANRTPDVEVVLVASNRARAGALERAASLGVPTWTFGRTELEAGRVTEWLREAGADFVALAGFLMKVPDDLVAAFSGRMLNLHPSLLPAFGGKGMYGHHVHEAVHAALAAGEVNRTGITLHWVDADYDTGAPFFQADVRLMDGDTPDSIAEKVRQLEVEHYAPQTLRAIRESLSLPDPAAG
tara:strand:+ start:370 stop:987 length:618 start_codon:yes stop_codon:yes gene_type:complete